MKVQAILITGNGFDLHHGLPTKYMDFMNITNRLINKASGISLMEGGGLLNEIDGLIKEYLNNEKLNKIIISTENRFWEDAQKNIWFQYFNFLIENKVIIDSWIDFENEISNLLLKTNEFLKEIPESPILQEDGFIFIDDRDSVTKSPKNLTVYEKINLINKNNYDYYLNSKYVKEMDNKYLSFDIEGYLEYLYIELTLFETCFKDYIKVIVNPLINFIKPDQDLFKNYSRIIYHYNFNYTDTFSIYNKHPSIKSKYIHGNVEKGNIIFGIDENQIKENNSNYLIFTKYYKRLIDTCEDSKAFIDLNNDEIKKIILFGHSLNKSDGSYVLQIFKHVDENNNSMIRKTIDLYTYDNLSQAKQIKNLIEICGKDLTESIFRNKLINIIYLKKEQK